MSQGEPNDLANRLAEDADFPLSLEEIRLELDPNKHIGRSIEQADRFLNSHPVPPTAPLSDILV